MEANFVNEFGPERYLALSNGSRGKDNNYDGGEGSLNYVANNKHNGKIYSNTTKKKKKNKNYN